MRASDYPSIIDLGDGRRLQITESAGGDVVGAIEHHPRADDPSKACCGAIMFDVPEAQQYITNPAQAWQVHSWDPLELSPSLQCRACGNHGFVRGGKWVPA